MSFSTGLDPVTVCTYVQYTYPVITGGLAQMHYTSYMHTYMYLRKIFQHINYRWFSLTHELRLELIKLTSFFLASEPRKTKSKQTHQQNGVQIETKNPLEN